MKEWNVIASLACVVVLIYVGGALAALLLGRIDGAAFKDAAVPIITLVLGYFGGLLKKD